MTKKVNVKVIARAKHNKLIKLGDGSYKIYVTSPPTEGRANQHIIKLLSKELNTNKSSLKIIKGLKNTNKLIEII